MTDQKWIPLHVHSEYSSLDGAIRLPAYKKWAEENEVACVGITDHGTMGGHPEADAVFSGSSVKPIYGCELYTFGMLPSIHEKNRLFHLVAYALNERGYASLRRIVSAGNHFGNDNAPPPYGVRLEHLEEYVSKGDIAFSSACIKGELPSLLLEGKHDEAVAWARTMRTLIGDNALYIELMRIGNRDQEKLNHLLHDFAQSQGLKEIVTGDCHYLKQDAGWYDALWAAQKKSTLESQTDPMTKRYDLSLKSPVEFVRGIPEWYSNALENTIKLGESVERFSLAGKKFEMPGKEYGVELETLARNSLEELLIRYDISGESATEYKERLETELSVVDRTGFSDYFLFVWDIMRFARKEGIKTGPGRGSAAGSILSWSLGITGVDPVKYGLLFERFLNPERVSMPDIDLDFEYQERERIIRYISEEYGTDRVCPIITYNRYGWRQAIGDAGRVLGYEAWRMSILSREISPFIGGSIFFESADEMHEEEQSDAVDVTSDSLVKFASAKINKFPGMKQSDLEDIFTLAENFKGLVRHSGKHAAGLVVTPGKITDYLPVGRIKGTLASQFDMKGIDRAKLVKIDILGLKTLTFLRNIEESANVFSNTTPSLEDLVDFMNRSGIMKGMPPVSSAGNSGVGISAKSISRSLQIIASGDTTGVFQLSGSGMRRLAQSTKPNNMEDLSALVSLYRPGPLDSGMTKEYSKSSPGTNSGSGLFPVSVRHVVNEIAKETRGFLVYQEQIMLLARHLAGYSLGEADILRKAMGKKDSSVMESEKGRFVKGCEKNGVSEEDALKTFEIMAHFCGYCFNKSHAMAYAFLGFASAWYKANRSPSFWCAYLDMKSHSGRKEDMRDPLRECILSHPVLPPSPLGEKCKFSDLLISSPVLNIEEGTTYSGELPESIWEMRNKWGVRIGLESTRNFGEKASIALADMDFESTDTLFDWMEKVITTRPLDAPSNVGLLSSFFFNGFFDDLMARTAEQCFGTNVAPVYVRAVLLGLGTSRENKAVAKHIKQACSPLEGRKKNPDDGYPFPLLKTRSVWGAFLAYAAMRIRRKMTYVRPNGRWDTDSVLKWISDYLMPIGRSIVEAALDEARAAQNRFAHRMDLFRSIYRIEHDSFGDGITLPVWFIGSEYVGWSFSLYADEMEHMKDAAFRGRWKNSPLHYRLDDEGLWMLGFFENAWFVAGGEGKMRISGRWGNASGGVTINIKDFSTTSMLVTESESIKKDGGMIALRIFSNDFGKNLFIKSPLDIVQIPLLSPSPSPEHPVFLASSVNSDGIEVRRIRIPLSLADVDETTYARILENCFADGFDGKLEACMLPMWMSEWPSEIVIKTKESKEVQKWLRRRKTNVA